MKRDLLIAPTAITAPIGDVCRMSVNQIGDSSALVFTPDSVINNSTLPGCIFKAFANVSTLSFSSVGLVGTIPQFDITPASTLKRLSIANNSLFGAVPSSFRKLNLQWLDISQNKLTHGLSNLENSSALTYLDISGNNFTNNAINTSFGNWIPQNFPNLRYFDLRGNNFNWSAMQAVPLSKMSSNSVMAAMRINIDGNLVCGDCSLGVQLSGECHTHSCSNATAIEEVRSTLLSYIENEVGHGGNLTILHTMRFCEFTTLFMVQYENPQVAARSVVNTIANLPNSDMTSSFVMNARSRTRCPPGRVGATCNYFCEMGWQRQAPTDGKGGYVHGPDSGGNDPADVYPILFVPVQFRFAEKRLK